MTRLADQALELQRAVHAAITSDTALQNLMGSAGPDGGVVRAYDDVPPDPVFPYLTYGRIRSQDSSGDDADQSSHQITLHIWSRETSRSEALALTAAVEAAVAAMPHRSVTLYTDIFRAPDGRTRHAVLRLSVIMLNTEGASQ